MAQFKVSIALHPRYKLSTVPLYMNKVFNEDKYFNKKITHLYTKPEHEIQRLLILRISSLCLSHFIFIISIRTDIKAKEY